MELKKFWNILRRRFGYLLATWIGVVLLTQLVSTRIHPVYQSTARLRLERSNEAGTLVPGLSSEFGAMQNISQAPTYTEVSALTSASVLQPVIQKQNLRKRETFLSRKHRRSQRLLRPEELASSSFIANFLQQRALSVRPLTNTDVIEIAAYDTSLTGSANLVNGVLASYLSFSNNVKRYAGVEGMQMLEKQLYLAQADLTSRQGALRSYQQEHGVVNLSEQSQRAVQREATLRDQISEAQRRLTVTEDRLAELKNDVSRLREPSEVTSQVEGNPQIQQLLSRLSDLNAQLQARLAVQTREHPEVRALQQQIEDTQNSLQREVQRIFGIAIADLKGEIAQLSKQLTSHTASMGSFPAQEVRMAELARNLDDAQKRVTGLQTNLQAAKTAQNLDLSNVTVLQWGAVPDPSNPYYPKKGLYTVIAILVGFLLGLAMVFLADYLDQSYRSEEGVQSALQLPLAGGVRHPEDVARALHGQALSKSGAMELGYNVSRLVEQGKKVVLISSAVQKDGKSQIAAVLATTLARRGLRTVLVDLDGREQALPANGASSGVTGILFDGASPESVVSATKQENLFHVPGGARGLDINSELDAPALARALDAYRHGYDAVVVNGPTILPSGEVLVLSSAVDAALLVVGMNRTQAPTVLQAKRRLDDAGTPLMGLVTSTN